MESSQLPPQNPHPAPNNGHFTIEPKHLETLARLALSSGINPFARPHMDNPDPTNEYMYQVPQGQGNRKSMSEGGRPGGDKYAAPLDLDALTNRLESLNDRLDALQPQSYSHYQQANPQVPFVPPGTDHIPPHKTRPSHNLPAKPPHTEAEPQAYSAAQRTNVSTSFLDPNDPDPDQVYPTYPSVTELAPFDSVSMYRSADEPSTTSGPTLRRGGTNIDGQEEYYRETGGYERAADRWSQSQWSNDNITQGSPHTVRRFEEEMTIGPTSIRTRGDLGRDMYEMRNRLLDAEAHRDQAAMTTIRRQISEAEALATASARLEAAEKQLRELQAKLIAEQVARTQIEHEAGLRSDEVKNYQNEWASAVRALKRAREEGRKTDEEKKRVQRCFEEARDKLWKYHEALRVREARAQGKEEGRTEAWQEAERWMGGAPPIPGIDPIASVPGAVLHQTPMADLANLLSPALKSPTANNFRGSQQHGQQQKQFPPQQQQQQAAQPPAPPMENIAQVMEYFARNPSAFPQFQQFSNGSGSYPNQPTSPQQVLNGIQHNASQQGAPQQYASQAPQNGTQQYASQQGMQSYPQQHQGQGQGAAAQFMGKTPTPPQAQVLHQQGFPPGQLQGNIQGQHQTPMGQPPAHLRLPTQQHPQLNSTRSAAQQLPRNNAPTAISTAVHVPMPEYSVNPHVADSYLDKVEHDPELKRMMSGARSKTVHTSAVPSTDGRYGLQPPSASRSHFDDSMSNLDKPLPPVSMANSKVSRAQSTRGPARGPSTVGSRRPNRRMSLSDGGQNYEHHHQRPMSQIPDGDRYPVFPLPGQNIQGGQKGYGQTASRDASDYQSNNTDRLNRGPSVSTRSRMADALRGDMEIEQGIPEVDERQYNHQGQIPPPMQMQNGGMRPPPSGHQRSQSGPPRPPPSMPNMRHRITTVMPQPLSSHQPRARSDFGPGEQPKSIAALYHDRDIDPAARANDRMPPPDSQYHPPRSHDMFVPPQLAPRAVSGGVEDVQGPRTSALGLSLGGGASERAGSADDSSRMRAPTSSRSRSNNPVSTVYPPSPEAQQPPVNTHPGPIRLDTPPGEHHDNVIEFAQSPSRVPFSHHSADARQPHDYPLPPSRSAAPTAYSRAPSSRSHAPSRSQPQTPHQHLQPHEVPLPGSRSLAPTAYSLTPDDTPPDSADVKTVDFAMRLPLPSGKGTAYDTRTTVSDEPEPDFAKTSRASSRQARRKPSPSNGGQSHRGNGSNVGKGASTDPRMYPVPSSKSRGKASTYAASVAPIEELTEPESASLQKQSRAPYIVV
ncbi:hypothetical protein L198_02194 [Cryptococcus wingfieldii CBS 7118]|uniref:Uncharacterized protein n=1 Tax=Cryptococcus wingfieldii CBS 7118 TaxID=1295528 RepID=A0A1E3JR42_9TREE|nr:hypothetical protein L198_02194 [Cryptococcus wingfieldii CBS 7118]ODO03348.1 hypothetical protein L198_02194 [Cryptococcus wingfieldii CBS 7118]